MLQKSDLGKKNKLKRNDCAFTVKQPGESVDLHNPETSDVCDLKKEEERVIEDRDPINTGRRRELELRGSQSQCL